MEQWEFWTYEVNIIYNLETCLFICFCGVIHSYQHSTVHIVHTDRVHSFVRYAVTFDISVLQYESYVLCLHHSPSFSISPCLHDSLGLCAYLPIFSRES